MKRNSSLLFLASSIFVLSVLLIISCNQVSSKIPVNEERIQRHIMPVKQAAEFTRRFRDDKDTLGIMTKGSKFLDSSFYLSRAESFNRDVFATLLNQDGADGIRIYNGVNDSGKVVTILVAIDKNGKDIIGRLRGAVAIKIPGISSAYAFQDGEVFENGQRCPDYCDEGSPLNQ